VTRPGRLGHHRAVTTTPATAITPARVSAPRPRPALAVVAVAVWALLVATVALEVVLSGRRALAELVTGFSFYAIIALVAYGAVGTVLAWRRPQHRLAWLALGIAGMHGVALATSTYGLVAVDRGLPGATWAVWAGGWTWVPAYWAVPTFLLLLFPDGRLPSHRWRPVVAVAVVGLVVSVLGWATLPYDELDKPLGADVAHPFPLPFAGRLMNVGGLLGVASIAGAFAALIARHHRSRGAERQQVRWVLLAGAATVALLAVAFATGPTGAGPVLVALAMVPLPAAIAVGVLRHRLWDVDLVINRSIVYAVLTLAVLTTYVTTVSLLGGVLGRSTGAPLLATALVAIGVMPARQWVQGWVNEVLYGRREDPYTALARLVERLDASDEAANPLRDVAETVCRVLRAPYAAVEVCGVIRSAWGHPGQGDLVHVPLAFRGETIGSLHVTLPGEALEPHDRRLLDDLARHIAVAAHTEQLTDDLRESRRHLVEAREEERRRIRRDLHDELGPTLASVAMRIEQARAAPDASGATAALEGVPERMREAVRSVRSLVEGLRPAALDELGLAAAIRQQASRFAGNRLTVDLAVDDDLGELSAAVDAAAYRIVSEALTNVVRHAEATTCEVVLRRDGSVLQVEVSDDGRGLAPAPEAGVGLRSMRERAAEVGGWCTVEPRPGRGTIVRAQLPVVP
jgi:two-component system NarL family sensor kinase